MNWEKLNKNLIVQFALELNLPDILSLCKTNKRFNINVCESDNFWFRKFEKDFGYTLKTSKNAKQNYKFVNDFINNQKYTSKDAALAVIEAGNSDLAKYYFNKNVIHVDHALEKSARYGHLKLVKFFVSQGGNITRALRYAAYGGHLDVVKYLIDQRADVHTDDEKALMWASEMGHLDIVKYLVNRGADVHIHNDIILRIAEASGHTDVVNYLKQQ